MTVELTEPWKAVGGNVLVTSRRPDDLKAFCDAFVQQFASKV